MKQSHDVVSVLYCRSFREWNPATVSCLKFGVFLGGFAGVYRVLRELLQKQGEKFLLKFHGHAASQTTGGKEDNR